jgi:hypothetical protein
MTDTAAPTVHSLIFKMEHDIGEAFHFGKGKRSPRRLSIRI